VASPDAETCLKGCELSGNAPLLAGMQTVGLFSGQQSDAGKRFARLFAGATMDPTGGRPESIDMLSLRERECLRLVHQGLNSKEIGLALKLSPHTVDHHLRHSIRKLSSGDRRAAARALAARESDDPIVRDWLRQTLSLVSAAGLVMDELAEASTSHGQDEHHYIETGRLPAKVEVERSGPDTGGIPASPSAAVDGTPPLHVEGGRSGFVFRGSAVGHTGGDTFGHQQAHVSVAPGISSQRELTLGEKTAVIIGMALTVLMVLRLIMPPMVSYLHALHAAGFI